MCGSRYVLSMIYHRGYISDFKMQILKFANIKLANRPQEAEFRSEYEFKRISFFSYFVWKAG